MKPLRIFLYTSGNFGKSLIVGAFELTLLFYLTDMIGAPPALAGTMILCTLIVDACCTIAIGFSSDGIRQQHHKAGRLIKTGAPLALISLSLLFALPLLGIHNLVAAFVLILMARISFILLDLPHAALMPRIEARSRKRNWIEISKFGFSALGFLLISQAVTPALNISGNPHIAQTLLLFGLITGILGPGSVLLSWYFVRDADNAVPAGAAPPAGQNARLRLKSLWHRNYLIIAALIALIPFTSHLFLKSLVYQASYVVGDVSATGSILSAMIAGEMLALPLWARLSGFFEKARTLQLALACMACGLAGYYFTATNPYLSLISAGMIGIGTCGTLPMLWSMAGDCIDLSYARSGQYCRTYGFGVLTFASKISLGLSAQMFALMLAGSGYQEQGDLPQSAIDAIRSGNALIPAAMALCCILLVSRYQLTYQRHRDIPGLNR